MRVAAGDISAERSGATSWIALAVESADSRSCGNALCVISFAQSAWREAATAIACCSAIAIADDRVAGISS